MSQMVVENLRSAVYASHEQLSAQMQAESALDSKLLGLLGFFAAAGSVLLTLPSVLSTGRVLLLAGIGLGAFACLVGSMGGASPDTGPPPAEFYAKYGRRAETEYLTQLLADMAATTQINDEGLELRRRALTVAVGAPVLSFLAYCLTSIVS